MNIPFHKLTPRHLLNLAPLLSVVSSALTYAGTDSYWLALAVAFICLTLHTLAMAIVWQIAVLHQEAEGTTLDHRTVAMPEPRHAPGDRYAYGAASPHDPRLWNHRPSGYCLPQVLRIMAAFTAVVLFIPVVIFILTAVFGAQEPRW